MDINFLQFLASAAIMFSRDYFIVTFACDEEFGSRKNGSQTLQAIPSEIFQSASPAKPLFSQSYS